MNNFSDNMTWILVNRKSLQIVTGFEWFLIVSVEACERDHLLLEPLECRMQLRALIWCTTNQRVLPM